jgi:hypothetical protein
MPAPTACVVGVLHGEVCMLLQQSNPRCNQQSHHLEEHGTQHPSNAPLVLSHRCAAHHISSLARVPARRARWRGSRSPWQRARQRHRRRHFEQASTHPARQPLTRPPLLHRRHVTQLALPQRPRLRHPLNRWRCVRLRPRYAQGQWRHRRFLPQWGS